MLNLLSDALKFTLQGEVKIALRALDTRVALSVSDTGAGIPKAEKIFERFHRFDASHARTHEGTGIGLAMVQELIRLHGGEVNVQSQEGSGSTFTISLPIGRAHLPVDRLLQRLQDPARFPEA